MDNEDDFFCDNYSKNHEITLEQRSTERIKSELKVSGYRDGIQKHMENEAHLQLVCFLGWVFWQDK